MLQLRTGKIEEIDLICLFSLILNEVLSIVYPGQTQAQSYLVHDCETRSRGSWISPGKEEYVVGKARSQLETWFGMVHL